jgi:predicted enzyme related to lactoylglutathione lyase
MNKRLINWFEIPCPPIWIAPAAFMKPPSPSSMQARGDGRPMHMALFPYADAPATGGALLACPEARPGDHGVVIYLDGGADLAVPLARAVAAGGTVLMPKTELSPEIGFIAMFADSEGNRIGLHSPGRGA